MQQTHHIGKHRETEAVEHLLGDGGTADHMTAFQDQGFEPRLRQLGAAHQAVVTRADDDRVVSPCHVLAKFRR